MPELQEIHKARARVMEMRHEYEEGVRRTSLMLRALDTLERVRKRDRSHLKGLTWIAVIGVGGIKAWQLVSNNRAAVISSVASAAVAGSAGVAIACATTEAESRIEARQPPAIAAPLVPTPRLPSERAPAPGQSPTTPPPAPSPTRIPDLQIPDLQIPTSPLPTTRPDKTKKPYPDKPGRPTTKPNTRPPTAPPGQTGSEGETLDDCIIKLHIGDLKPFC